MKEFKILPLAFESLGVRGMCTYVETGGLKILFDPGCALGPRFSLPPHEKEYLALSRARERILKASRRAQILVVSHYHFDHYTPHFEDWQWIGSSPEFAQKLYRGKILLAKDFKDLPPIQRKRGYLFQKFNRGICKEFLTADGKSFKWGRVVLEVSPPQPHGLSTSAKILMFALRQPASCLVYAPDLQGTRQESVELILKWEPSVLIAGGPPLYLAGYRLKKEEIETATSNLLKLVREIPLTIVDHHLFRSLDSQEYLQRLAVEARKTGHEVKSAAELLGQKPELLEASRKELYQKPDQGISIRY
ncbi:MAG: hypothetical protein QXH26_05365 [Candidatus Hadarchaeales archaeon]